MNINNKWVSDYIENINLAEIEWIKLDVDELTRFYQENYLDMDEWKYITSDISDGYVCSPLGLRYLHFNYNKTEYKFLLGIVNNNIGKKTIVAAMVYLENYYMFVEQIQPLIYISSLEVNSYFWNNGIYKRMCEEIINFINPNQHIILSMESDMGRKYETGRIFKEILMKNGFKRTIWIDTFSIYSNKELYDIVCSKSKVLEKIN